jgi:hypothetical protein
VNGGLGYDRLGVMGHRRNAGPCHGRTSLSRLASFFGRQLGVPMHGEKPSMHQTRALTTQLAAGSTTPCDVVRP